MSFSEPLSPKKLSEVSFQIERWAPNMAWFFPAFFHIHSIAFMWTPVQRSTNQIDWFILVPWYNWNFIDLIVCTPFIRMHNWSWQVIPLNFEIQRFSALIFHKNEKSSLVTESLPPNTKFSRTYRPQLLFRFDINVSYIGTTTPSHPIVRGFLVNFPEQESQK